MRSRLAAVLRLRTVHERRARGRLAEADREVARSRQAVERRREQLPPPPPKEVLSPQQLHVLALQGVRSNELLEEAAAEHQRTIELRAEAEHEWSQRSVERKSVERLDERRRAEAAIEAAKAAERVLDELTILRRGWQR